MQQDVEILMLWDTCMRNKGASYEEAGCFAAAMSTIKLEKSGPFSGTEEQVWNIIRNSNLHPQVI